MRPACRPRRHRSTISFIPYCAATAQQVAVTTIVSRLPNWSGRLATWWSRNGRGRLASTVTSAKRTPRQTSCRVRRGAPSRACEQPNTLARAAPAASPADTLAPLWCVSPSGTFMTPRSSRERLRRCAAPGAAERCASAHRRLLAARRAARPTASKARHACRAPHDCADSNFARALVRRRQRRIETPVGMHGTSRAASWAAIRRSRNCSRKGC